MVSGYSCDVLCPHAWEPLLTGKVKISEFGPLRKRASLALVHAQRLVKGGQLFGAGLQKGFILLSSKRLALEVFLPLPLLLLFSLLALGLDYFRIFIVWIADMARVGAVRYSISNGAVLLAGTGRPRGGEVLDLVDRLLEEIGHLVRKAQLGQLFRVERQCLRQIRVCV